MKLKFRLIIVVTLLLGYGPITLAKNKFALVIGNSNYRSIDPLPNPVNDAKAMAKRLRQLGFRVLLGTNLSKQRMRRSLNKFSKLLNEDSIAVFYYAGHGIQTNGRNFLIPVNATLNQAFEIEYESIELNRVLSAFNEANVKISMAFIDACRDNPFEKRLKGLKRSGKFRGRGLAPIENTHGTILSYATMPGETAVDGYGKHSPYTTALLKQIRKPNVGVQEMLNEVGLQVMQETDGDQKPWFASSPIERFCFAGCKNKGRGKVNSANLTIANKIRDAIAQKDLEQLKKLTRMNKQELELFKGLFATYSTLKISTLIPTKSLGKGKKIITIHIKEAINYNGNRVIPSDGWNYISLTLRRQG